jgi:hypothetical protein
MEAMIYELSGLRIASDLPLFGVQVCQNEAGNPCDIQIRCSRIPATFTSATVRVCNGKIQHKGSYDGRELLLEFPTVGRFLLRAGNEIEIDLAPCSNKDEVRAYLLGVVFGALCHQRGITPLHASAIDVADGCATFVGDSGSGKSTLVAALARRGHAVITDDVCFLQPGTGGDTQVWPGISRIRLWADAKAALGFNGPGIEREIHEFDKYFIPIGPPPNPIKSRRLRLVYQLHRVPTGAPTLTRLHGAAAVEVLMQNVYASRLAERLGRTPHAFLACTVAARDVPVFRFSRPWDIAALDRGAEMLENHLSTSIS